MNADVRCGDCGTLIRWWWSMCDTCWRRRQTEASDDTNGDTA